MQIFNSRVLKHMPALNSVSPPLFGATVHSGVKGSALSVQSGVEVTACSTHGAVEATAAGPGPSHHGGFLVPVA